jgi:hypothetical protein
MGSKGGSDKYARDAARLEAEKQRKITEGTARVRGMFQSQFTPEFYDKVKSDYLAFYKPQMEHQYEDQQRSLVYALARSGLSNSSVRGDKFGDLQEQYDIQKVQLADRANQAANQRREQVQEALESTLGQLQSSADVGGAQQNAANYSKILTEQSAYSPLGQVFQDATAGLATQAELERRGQSRYNTGLFSGGTKNTSGATVT